MTEEESATLLAPPAPESAPADAASTVMFRAGDLPWNVEPAPAPPAPAFAATPEPVPAAPPLREPEPVFTPEVTVAGEVTEEPTVFEEVLEEDLDFGAHGFEPEPHVERADIATLPPVPSEDEGGVTGAFEPLPDPRARACAGVRTRACAGTRA